MKDDIRRQTAIVIEKDGEYLIGFSGGEAVILTHGAHGTLKRRGLLLKWSAGI